MMFFRNVLQKITVTLGKALVLFRMNNVVFLSCIGVIAIAMLTLIGWHFDIYSLKHPFNGHVAMNPMTAIVFLFAALSFLFQSRSRHLRADLGKCLACLVVMIGGIKVFSLLAGYQGGIDTLLFTDKLFLDMNFGKPNRMAPNAAFNSVLLGMSLLFFQSKDRNKILAAGVCTSITALIAVLSVYGYLNTDPSFYRFESFTPMAIHAALCFFILAMVMLFGYERKSPVTETTYAVGVAADFSELSQVGDKNKLSNLRLPLAAVATVLLLTGMIYINYDSGKSNDALWYEKTEMDKLIKSAVYLDEAFTMSTYIALETGDTNWEKRYQLFVPEFDSVLNRLNHTFLATQSDTCLQTLNSSAAELFAMETKAFQLFHRNQKDSAKLIVQGTAYRQQKDTYKQSLAGLEQSFAGYFHAVQTKISNGIKMERRVMSIIIFIVLSGWFLLLRNINKTKKLLAQQALVLRAERNKLNVANEGLKRQTIFFNQSMDLLCTATLEGYFEVINDSFTRELGYTTEEIKSIPFITLLHPDDVAPTLKEMERLASGITTFNFENRYRHKNGTYIWLQWNCIVFEGLMYANARNTTEAKLQAERIKQFNIELENIVAERTRELSENRYFLEKAQEVAHIGHWVFDIMNNSITWSEETHRIFGVPTENFDGSAAHYFNLVHPDDITAAQSAINNSMEYNTVYDVEHRIVRPDGTVRWTHSMGDIKRDANGMPVLMFGVVKDITDRKKLEMERQQVTEELIRQNRDLSQFAFIVSHNLRAPLANITGFADALQVATLPEALRQKFTKELSVGAHKMDNVISDLNIILQVKREADAKKETVRFSTLVSDINDSLSAQMEKDEVVLRSDFTAIDELHTLKPYMHSIFYNLISNSIKYRRENETPVIEITSLKIDDGVRLTFKDNGMGIDLAKKGSQVFGLYKRFHLQKEGKGMGLYMVKTQIESLGGTISIASKPNEGTTFTIEFQQAA